jgi:hypothetical protein
MTCRADLVRFDGVFLEYVRFPTVYMRQVRRASVCALLSLATATVSSPAGVRRKECFRVRGVAPNAEERRAAGRTELCHCTTRP